MIGAYLLAGLIATTPAQIKPYRVIEENGRWWIQKPDGSRFWSFGVCCTGPGSKPDDFNPKNPSYSAYRLFPSLNAWSKNTLGNLTKWGFNSLGGWSDYKLLPQFPHFEVLHLGGYCRAPWDDLFSSKSYQAMNRAAKDQILRMRNDPSLVGYFTDNELGWWGDTVFLAYLAMPESSKGKQALMSLIRSHYKSRFDLFTRDWETESSNFDGLAKTGKATLRSGGRGMELVNRWLETIGKHYYQTVHHLIRQYDPHRMILGDRYAQFYSVPIVRASRPYVDVVSSNFGATWNDGTFAQFFLDGLHQITGKPVIITEFYMSANENRSGNKNVPPAFPVVQTQNERAQAFARNVKGLAEVPYVVGAHWFQFWDEPPHGRGDGENFNHGLVDIFGKPYKEMVQASSSAHPVTAHLRGPARIARGIPRAAGNLLQSLKSWPRAQGLVKPSGLSVGDLYTCWSPDALYLGVRVMDYMDEKLYAGGQVPESERSLWSVHLGGISLPIDVRFGGKDRRALTDPLIKLSEEPGLQHTVLIRIPAARLGLKRLKAGTKVQFDSEVSTHSRAFTMRWHADLRLK